MTVGTGRTDATAVSVVNGLLVFPVHIVFHFVTGDTEIQGVGCLHGGVETTPENHTDDHEKQGRAKCGSQQDLA